MRYNRSGYNRYNYENNADKHREFAIKHIMDLIDNGIKVMGAHPQGNAVDRWLEYSQKIIEISSKDYDPNIYLHYLRLIMSVRTDMYNNPQQKIKTCLDYLLGVVKILNDNSVQRINNKVYS